MGLDLAEEGIEAGEGYPRVVSNYENYSTDIVELQLVGKLEIPVSRRIANFYLKLNHRAIEQDTGLELLNITICNAHRSKTINVRSEAISTKANAQRKSIEDKPLLDADFIFNGNENDYSFFIEKLISDKKVDEFTLVQKTGMFFHKKSQQWLWVNDKGAYDKNGLLVNEVKVANFDITFNNSLIPKNHNKKVEKDVFYQFNESRIVVPYIGFTIATLYKQRFRNCLDDKGFPLIWSIGRSQSGKTTTMKFIKNILRMEKENNFDMFGQTKFPLMKHMSSNFNLPLFLDENKPKKPGDKTLWTNFINASFDGSAFERGRADQSTIGYDANASVISNGEIEYGDDSNKNRCIIIDTNRNPNTKPKHQKGFEEMTKSNYGWVGDTMLHDALNISDNEIIETYNFVKSHLKIENINQKIDDRFLHTYSIIGFAMIRLGELCGETSSIEKSLNVISQLVKQRLDDKNDDISTKDGMAGKLLHNIWTMIQDVEGRIAIRYKDDSTTTTQEPDFFPYRDTDLIQNINYIIEDDNVLLHLPSIEPKYTKWCKDHDEPNTVSMKDLKKQIQHHPQCIEKDKPKTRNTQTKRYLVMNIKFFENDTD
jgi:hypothetical protein